MMPNTTFAPGYHPPWYRPREPAPLDIPVIAFMRCRSPMRLCDIAKATSIQAGTISHVLQRLTKQGVVRKQGRLFEFVGALK